MSNSYKFFRHSGCEYFPCHKVNDNEKFNCLFCFCPLYLVKDCGGNNKFINGIKDCSNCLIPHSENGYEYIVSKISKYHAEQKENNNK